MILKPDGTVRFLTVGEHLQRKTLIYQDRTYTIHLSSDKHHPFRIVEEGSEEDIYIDIFALHFGQKERLKRRTGTGWASIPYCCNRAKRDMILLLPVDELIDEYSSYQCRPGCQYYSPPTGVKGPYVFNCILLRYRVLGIFDLKSGLTLEEVGRIYGCTRERIRQIQKNAMRKLRHITRLNRLQIFQERVSDYRDVFYSMNTEKIA
jgi:hypothetical protein